MKIVLIGAGSMQFGLGSLGDIFQSNTLSGSEIVLLDIDAHALEAVNKIAQHFVLQQKLSFSIVATTNRSDALKNADFIIISIEIGKRWKLWEEDWTIPQQYGINQIYGENGGIGGIFHALRIVPKILEICDDIVKYCPNAYVFNFSNPMTAIVTTVLRKYPNLKFFGLCHEISSLGKYLPQILGTAFENLNLYAAGLNHFSILVTATYRDSGLDAYPDILDKAPQFFEKEPGYSDVLEYVKSFGITPHTEGFSYRRNILGGRCGKRSWADRTLFHEIVNIYRVLPITTDSHLGEYISWAHEIADHRGIKDFYVLYQMMLQNLNPKIELKLHERIVPIIEGLLGAVPTYKEQAINILNTNLLPELPSFIAVEVPANISKGKIEGIKCQNYPIGFAALLRNYVGVYDLIAEAVLKGKKDYVIQAILANPIVTTYRKIPELVDLMIDRQKEWLSYIK